MAKDSYLEPTGSQPSKSPTNVARTPQPKVQSQSAAADTGKNPDTPFEALISREGWQDNRLNDLHQPTYHIRLFMTDDEPFDYKQDSYDKLVQFIYNKQQTTIAESGVTGLNISSLEIKTIPATNPVSRSMQATKIEMTLSEPMGTSLMDILADAAYELRVRNYSKTHFFMEVKFIGYDEDGTVNMAPFANEPNKGIWLYHLFLTNIEMKVDSTGSVYNLSFIPFEERLQDDNDMRLPDPTSVEGETVGEIFKKLAESLNHSVKNMYGYATREYVFEFKKFAINGANHDPATFKVVPKNPDSNPQRSNAMIAVEGGKVKAHFARGMALNDIVDQVFANSSEAQSLAKDIVEIEKITDDKQKKMRESTVFQMNVVTEVMGYDYATENYIIRYRIIIGPYYTQRPILSKEQVEASKLPSVQAANMLKLRKNGYLVKRYDYIFTGMNTEVLDLDIKFNTAWTAMLPRVMGYSNSLSAQEVHSMKNPYETVRSKQQELADVNNKLRERAQLQEEVNNLKQQGAPSKYTEKIIAEKNAKLNGYNESELVTRRTALVSEIEKNRNELQKKEESNRLAAANVNRPKLKYAEEVFESQALIDYNRGMPVSLVQSTQDSRYNVSGAFPESHGRDRSIFGAVMDQLYETQGMAMNNITMEIKGDPYWMGSGNFMRSYQTLKFMDKVMNLSGPDEDNFAPDMSRGDIMFLLTFRYPRGVDSYGLPILKPNEFFTGVYILRGVQHKFANGQFTQTLDAIRAPLLDVFKAFGYRDKEELEQARYRELAAQGLASPPKSK